MFDLFLPLAFMLSPRALVAVGNGIGMSGMLFGFFLLVGFASALFTSNGMGIVPKGNNASRVLRSFGLGLITSARLLALLTLATLWISEAGFSFNEVITDWYPHLAFSFTLIVLVLGASLLPDTIRGAVLYLTTLITLAGVGYVSAMATQPHGLESWFPTMFPQKTPPFFPSGGDPMQGAYLALLALLGFDFATRPDAGKGASRSMLALLLAVGVFLIYLWGGLSAADPFDLSGSSVPHMLVAGIALGERGRQIMGIVVQTGTFSATLALLTVCTRQIQVVCRRADNDVLRKFSNVLLCAGIAVLFGLGWAGDPRLDTLIAAALVSWFAGYAFINLAQLVRGVLPPLAVIGMLIYIFAGWMAFDASHDLRLFGYTTGGIAVAGLLFSLGLTQPKATEDSDQSNTSGESDKKTTKK